VAGWADYHQREPWGFPIADLRAAMAMHVTAAVAGAKEVKVDDFMLGDQLRMAAMTDDEKQMEMLKKVFAGTGVLLGSDGKPIS
jgi:hypothetical protein